MKHCPEEKKRKQKVKVLCALRNDKGEVLDAGYFTDEERKFKNEHLKPSYYWFTVYSPEKLPTVIKTQ